MKQMRVTFCASSAWHKLDALIAVVSEWVNEWMRKPSSSMLWTELRLIQSWPFLHFPPNSLFLEYVKFVCWSCWGNLPYLYLCFTSFLFVHWDRRALCSSSWTETHYVDQVGLELRVPSASASRALGLKACITMPATSSSLAFKLVLEMKV